MLLLEVFHIEVHLPYVDLVVRLALKGPFAGGAQQRRRGGGGGIWRPMGREAGARCAGEVLRLAMHRSRC